MLYAFDQHHSDAGVLQGTMYLLSGIKKSIDGSELKEVKLVKEKELKKAISEMITVCSIHVYSVKASADQSFDRIHDNLKQDVKKSVSLSAIVNERAVPIRSADFAVADNTTSQVSKDAKSESVTKRCYQKSIKDFAYNLNQSKKTKLNPNESVQRKQTNTCQEFPAFGGCHDVQVSLWVDKYKPANSKSIIGQQGDGSSMNKLKFWLQNWNKNHMHLEGKMSAPKTDSKKQNKGCGAWAKCALLSGPSGIGKTMIANLVSQELGFDVVEMNASQRRCKKMLGESVSDTLNTTSINSMRRKDYANKNKRVLIMDEVDGMAGNEDRGGISKLIQLIKHSLVPIICICNDRNHQKIRSLATHCFDLRISRPTVMQIRAAMMSVCFNEEIQIKPDALSDLIISCDQDVRQVLNQLSMAGDGFVNCEKLEAEVRAERNVKTSVKINPWEVCYKVFNVEEHKTLSFLNKFDLYFYDYRLSGLFVQENYLCFKPSAACNDRKKLMDLVSLAADSISEGDVVENAMRNGMNWDLLQTAAVFCSVLPGEYMSGKTNFSKCTMSKL